LETTLATIRWQRGVDLEVVVVDDGSSDGTREAIEALGDHRIRTLRHEVSTGVSGARNDGIGAARGAWIAFCDDDDLWAPDKLERQLAAAESIRREWAYCGAVKIDERNAIVGGTPPPPPDVLAKTMPTWSLMPGGCSGVVTSRAALDRAGLFDPKLVNLADWDLWMRLVAGGLPAMDPRPLVGYRFHGGQSSLDLELILREVEMLDGRYGQRVDRGEVHRYLGWRCVRAGRRGAGARHFGAAFMRKPVPVAADVWGLVRGRIARMLPALAEPPRVESAISGWRRDAEEWLARAPVP
jgi:glycosyltransferase involved in cell wall biosynthesis